MIQPDRNMYGNKRDYINFTNGIKVTSPEFDNKIKPYIKKYGYKEACGTFTDIGEIIYNGVNVSAFNLSCYLNAHTSFETVWLPLYEDALNLVNDVITNLSYKRWSLPVIYKQKKTKFNSWDFFDDSPDDKWFDKKEDDYFDVAMSEAYSCIYGCNSEHAELLLDNTIFCKKCQKTLGEKHLIENQVADEYDPYKEYFD